MNILLVYPRFNYHNTGGLQEPLGIMYIEGALKSAGHNVTLKDLTFDDSPKVLAQLLKDVDMIGISSTTALMGKAIEVLEFIRDGGTQAPIVAGGPHPTVEPLEALQAGFDYVVLGEGEKTITEFVEAIQCGADVHQVPGIAWLEDNEAVFSAQRGFVSDLDSLTFPVREHIDYAAYLSAGLKFAGIMATRGCPYLCSYCKPMQDKLFGSKIRRRSPENVVDEVQHVMANTSLDGLLFRDDTLMMLPTVWFEEFGRLLRSRNSNLWGWVCQARVDQVHENKLEAMKAAGLKMIAFGVESGSQKILDYYKKGIQVEQTIAAFELCRKYEIATHAFVMIGAPHETIEDVDKTIGLLELISPNSITPLVTAPTVGTHLHTESVAEGTYLIKAYEDADYSWNLKGMKRMHLSGNYIASVIETINGMGTGYGSQEKGFASP